MMLRLLITNSRRMKQETLSPSRSDWCYETFLQLAFPRDKHKVPGLASFYDLKGIHNCEPIPHFISGVLWSIIASVAEVPGTCFTLLIHISLCLRTTGYLFWYGTL